MRVYPEPTSAADWDSITRAYPNGFTYTRVFLYGVCVDELPGWQPASERKGIPLFPISLIIGGAVGYLQLMIVRKFRWSDW